MLVRFSEWGPSSGLRSCVWVIKQTWSYFSSITNFSRRPPTLRQTNNFNISSHIWKGPKHLCSRLTVGMPWHPHSVPTPTLVCATQANWMAEVSHDLLDGHPWTITIQSTLTTIKSLTISLGSISLVEASNVPCSQSIHHQENGNKILYEVVVFFNKQDRTFKVPCCIQIIKDVVDL